MAHAAAQPTTGNVAGTGLRPGTAADCCGVLKLSTMQPSSLQPDCTVCPVASWVASLDDTGNPRAIAPNSRRPTSLVSPVSPLEHHLSLGGYLGLRTSDGAKDGALGVRQNARWQSWPDDAGVNR
jgi:hypothetical protein